MEQNDFYEVDGCMDFIPVTINETYAGRVGVTVDNYMLDYRLVVKEVYRFPKVQEPQKPKVSRVAVEFYEKYKDEILSLDEWFRDFYSKEAIEDFPRMEELTEWLRGNDNETNRRRELALATLVTLGIDAVEVEKEKLYTVEIPDPHGIYKIRYLFRNGVGNIRIEGSDYRDIFLNVETHLTESEIKKDFEWAWDAGFAKEVE